jgi:quercetin dioxygenase-like cupin family protein
MADELVRATEEEKSELITRLGEVPEVDLMPGVRTRIIPAQNMTLSFAHIGPNVIGKPHSHDNEQVIVGLSGQVDILLDGKLYAINAGEVIVVPGGAEHTGLTGEDECRVVEIFSPARKDFEEKLVAASAGVIPAVTSAPADVVEPENGYPRASEEEWASRVTRVEDVPMVELRPGSNTAIVPADNVTLSFLHLSPGLNAKPHSHPHEQVVVLLKGEMEIALDGKLYSVKAGEVGVIPGGIPHSGVTIDQECEVLDVFSPARKDFEEKLADAREQQG